MNWKNRLTNYNFWISIVSAVLLILQAFEFHFDIMYINEIATAVLGLLVVIGIINDPTKSSTKKETNKTQKTEKDAAEETEKVGNNNVETEVVEKPNEEKTMLENSTTKNVENVEEQTFPIDEENEIGDNFDENDIKNLVNNISNDINSEKENLKEMFENLLILLKNNEKPSENIEILENFSLDEEKTKEKLEEIKPEISTEISIEKELVEECVEPKFEKIIDPKVENLEEIKLENSIQPVEELEVQASSFNIVNW